MSTTIPQIPQDSVYVEERKCWFQSKKMTRRRWEQWSEKCSKLLTLVPVQQCYDLLVWCFSGRLSRKLHDPTWYEIHGSFGHWWLIYQVEYVWARDWQSVLYIRHSYAWIFWEKGYDEKGSQIRHPIHNLHIVSYFYSLISNISECKIFYLPSIVRASSVLKPRHPVPYPKFTIYRLALSNWFQLERIWNSQ